jgi:hypothetical protein
MSVLISGTGEVKFDAGVSVMRAPSGRLLDLLGMADTFTCPFCHLLFSLRTEFEDHLRSEHPDRYNPKPPARPSPPPEHH